MKRCRVRLRTKCSTAEPDGTGKFTAEPLEVKSQTKVAHHPTEPPLKNSPADLTMRSNDTRTDRGYTPRLESGQPGGVDVGSPRILSWIHRVCWHEQNRIRIRCIG